MITDLMTRFEDRYAEIVAYLDFLDGIENLLSSGVPRLGGDVGPVVTTQQLRILYSSVYLQLYNLVESTVTGALDAISKAAIERAVCAPGDLSDDMRREWVKQKAGTSVEMNAEKRLDEALALCEHLVGALPVEPFVIEKGGGGNWHDGEIKRIAKRIGCDLRVSHRAKTAIGRVVRNDLGAMGLVVSLRNALAHGNISFGECGQSDTAADLRRMAAAVDVYLREVVAAFGRYITEQRYLRPERRSPAHSVG